MAMNENSQTGKARRALLRALSSLLALSLVSCALSVSFDEYGTRAAPVDGLFAVRGTVTGLEGTSTTLLLTKALGNVALEVGDGAFAFPAVVGNGAGWTITAPDTQTHSCAVLHGVGTIFGAAGTGVAVTCVSKNATLSALQLVGGALSPAFTPSMTSYTASARGTSLLASATAMVLATPSHPDARVTIAGAVSRGGTTEIRLHYGLNPIAVTVTAPDRHTQVTYALVVSLGGVDDAQTVPGVVRSVALSGSTLAVCYQLIDPDGTFSDAPAVRIYEHAGSRRARPVGSSSGWQLQANIPQASAVAVDGDMLVVAGPPDGAHVFTRGDGFSWAQTAVLPGVVTSVAIAGDTVAVAGAPTDPAPGPTNQVRIYTRSASTWSQQASLDFSGFGPSPNWTALSLSGDRLAVGTAYEAMDGSRPPNAAFVFSRSGTVWSQEGYFESPLPIGEGGFGALVVLSGDTLAVGAPYEHTVYVYTRAGPTWSAQSSVKAVDPSKPSSFGASVALSGDTLAVGSPAESAASIVTRRNGTWSHQVEVEGSDATKPNMFGGSVALSSGKLVVSANPDVVYGF